MFIKKSQLVKLQNTVLELEKWKDENWRLLECLKEELGYEHSGGYFMFGCAEFQKWNDLLKYLEIKWDDKRTTGFRKIVKSKKKTDENISSVKQID